MGLESAQHINELNPANPAPGDKFSRQDNHTAMIKQCLVNDLKNIGGLVEASDVELSHVKGATSNLQDQLDQKVDTTLFPSVDASVQASDEDLSMTEGARSNLQQQIDSKAASGHGHVQSEVTGLESDMIDIDNRLTSLEQDSGGVTPAEEITVSGLRVDGKYHWAVGKNGLSNFFELSTIAVIHLRNFVPNSAIIVTGSSVNMPTTNPAVDVNGNGIVTIKANNTTRTVSGEEVWTINVGGVAKKQITIAFVIHTETHA